MYRVSNKKVKKKKTKQKNRNAENSCQKANSSSAKRWQDLPPNLSAVATPHALASQTKKKKKKWIQPKNCNLKHNGRVAKNGTRRFSKQHLLSQVPGSVVGDCVTLIINYQVVESWPNADQTETPQRVARCSHSAFINFAKRQAKGRTRNPPTPQYAPMVRSVRAQNDHLHHLPTTY